jgi:methylase of polypeptide subunit release factors
MGTGTGIGALVASRYAKNVHAVDIDPRAVDCARENVMNTGNNLNVKVYSGDLFEPVKNFVYDLILFNPPYIAKTPSSPGGHSFNGGENLETIERFFKEAKNHLSSTGIIYFLCSNEGQNDRIEEFILKYGYTYSLADIKEAVIERFYLYLIEPERQNA